MFKKGNDIGKATQFQKGNRKGGRKPNPARLIKELPKDAQMKVYDRLHTAIALGSVKEAAEYLKKEADELGEYGFILQLAVKSLMGKNGWFVLMDICDRLFGKPRMTAEIHSAEGFSVNIQVPDSETADALNKIMEG